MSLQIPILGNLIITLIARISDFFMYRLNMNLKISLSRSLMVTLITRIFDFFMYRLNMSLQTSLFCSLVVTLIARIFVLTLLASIVYKAKQKLENISQGKVVLSFL